MRVHCLQLDVAWEDRPANHDRASALLAAAAPDPGDLVLLPEMFATGFSMRVDAVSDTHGGETRRFLAAAARERGIYLAAGIVLTGSDGRGQNVCALYAPDGSEAGRYVKMHPFSYGGESRHYARGAAPLVLDCGPARVAPFVCYDLRFPEVFRTAAVRGATVFAVVANWPSPRVGHWELLLRARAVENQAYVAGVNRCGRDPHLEYPGRSMIVDPKGRVAAEAGAAETTLAAGLDFDALAEYRRDFPALADVAPGYVRG